MNTFASTDNPFSTRHVRPGAAPFLFQGDQTAAALVDRLQENGWRGQIVGPHGSGKSTLLSTLLPAVEHSGRCTCLIELHDGQRRLPAGFWKGDSHIFALRKSGQSPKQSTLLVVDGYEQLGRFQRFRLKRFCRRGGLGLLVTAHASVGLPELFCTTAELTTVQRLVEQLQREYTFHVTPAEVAERFSQHAGNVREVFFDLYDLYESRRRG